jgi:hypothetical protein
MECNPPAGILLAMPTSLLLGSTAIIAALVAPPTWPVDAALVGLEQSGASLSSFAANVILEKHRSFEGTTERRFGRLVMEGEGADRRLGCRIDRLIVDDRATDSYNRFVYDDGWLGDINLADRSFIKRQLVEPGSSWDPLKLGEGPLPLPFGQPADEVRARFSLAMTTVPASPLLASVMRSEDLVGLKLTPNPGTKLAESAKYVEVFYDADSLTPRLVNLVEPNGDHSMVILIRPVMNASLTDDDRALMVMPDPDPTKWATVEVRPWSPSE